MSRLSFSAPGAGFAVAVALIVAVAVTASQPHPALPEVFPPEAKLLR